jgi:3-dehydroquinate synthetase/shikimate kinase
VIVALVGLPGAGKTRIGRELAERLGLQFLDTDQMLQERLGAPAAELYERLGEAAFRDEETRTLKEALSGRDRVVSTGGGTVLRPDNRRLLRNVRVLGLTARDPQLLSRLRGGRGRPVLAPNPADRLQILRRDRLPFYEEVAEAWFWTESAPTRAVERIVEFLALERLGTGVYFGRGARRFVGSFSGFGGSLLLTQPPLAEGWARALLDNLRYGERRATMEVVPDGEAAKDFRVYEGLLRRMAERGMTRDETVVAVGGGAVTDLGGFLAASYMRGVPLILVPTTVVGQADAALGGKTGINLPEGKNLVGAFYPARATLVDPDTLRTLPLNQFRDGLAEVVKCGVGLDAELFAACAAWRRPPAGAALDFALARAARAKLRVVAADPRESGERAKLNLGHTAGHAVEAASGYRLSHGRAVSVGLAAIARLAERRYAFAQAADVLALLRRLDLPTHYQGDPQDLWGYLVHDKKHGSLGYRLVVPLRIGRCEVVSVDEEEMRELAALACTPVG